MQSEQLNELAKALSKAQGEMKPPTKDKTAKAGTYSYSYVDLAAVIECVKGPLADNGLSFVQMTNVTPDGLVLETRLMHSSGQWLAGTYPLPQLAKAQDMGSALTYAKRYALCSILGIAAEDDDDGAAAQNAPRANGNGRAAPKPPAAPAQRPTATSAPPRDMDAEYSQAVSGRIPDDPPPHDEETGEIIEAPPLVNAPHPKSKDTVWKAYAKSLAAAAAEAPTRAWLVEFQKVNHAGIDAIKGLSAAMKQWLDERFNEIDAQFAGNGVDQHQNVLAAG